MSQVSNFQPHKNFELLHLINRQKEMKQSPTLPSHHVTSCWLRYCVPLLLIWSRQSWGFAPPMGTTLSYPSPSRVVGVDGRSSSSTTRTTTLFGIPKMFRWLTDQYPDILNRRLEEGISKELQVDSFYLDMNGIIHPCTHGNAEGELVILDEAAMFKKIFLSVDRLYKLVQPTNVLYLAVDGVAPRAKMNQQRSRRFRSAKEAEVTASELLAQGKLHDEGRKRFDSNCITPGTDFMLKLSFAMLKVRILLQKVRVVS